MSVGSVWRKNSSGVWVTGQPYFKSTSAGWLVGANIYEKTNSTTWTLRYFSDTTPPAVPVVSGGIYDTVNRDYTLTVKAPADADVVQACIKASQTGYPVNPGVQDGNGPTDVQADGTPFWLWNTTPNASSTRVKTGMVSGIKYYWSVWVKDSSGNWSAPVNFYFTFPQPAAPTKTLTTKSAYVNVTDSASWRSNYGWRTDNNYVYQGGPDNFQGFWFYGTAIASLLSNAESLTKAEIYIQRSSSSHGIAGDGNIMLGHHDLTSQPSGSPGTNRVVGETNVVDLARGEGKWVTMQSAWHNNFLNGDYRGVGCMYQTTSVTSSYYNIMYGKGTSSGKLKFTWTEYV
jgi:hypothetical protein